MRKTASVLFVCVVALVSLGIVMLASTSSVRAIDLYQDPFHFLKRQLVWLAFGLCIGTALFRLDYHWFQRCWVPFVLLAVVLLVLALVPEIGREVGGSKRWLAFGPLRFQPSEMAKLAVVVGLAAWMTRIQRRTKWFREGLLYPVCGLGVVLVLLLLEPDFGTTILVGTVGMIVMFVGGANTGYLAITGVLGLSAFTFAVLQDPVRMARVFAFLWPKKYPATAYHLTQSKAAFIHGGPVGVGLGDSIQKQYYLPEAHTDFILAIIGEELGFYATGGVVLLFVLILFCGLSISHRAPDKFGRLLGVGITIMLVIQAGINVGVVTGCLPTKGLALPFISYGGSSLVAAIAGVGILLNIATQARVDGDDHTRSIRDRNHEF